MEKFSVEYSVSVPQVNIISLVIFNEFRVCVVAAGLHQSVFQRRSVRHDKTIVADTSRNASIQTELIKIRITRITYQ